MKKFFVILILLRLVAPVVFGGQLKMVDAGKVQSVFFGENKKIPLVFQNSGDKIFNGEIRVRVFQTSSATAALSGEFDWKKLEVLPQQTILESTRLDFPAVKAETKFLVQWLENSNVLGVTEVWVYPTNLLLELQSLAGDKAIGILDPQNELKPLLKNLRIDFDDLGEVGVTNFSGRLAIVGAFQSKSQVPDDLPEQIKMLAKKNTAVVWIQPLGKSDKLKPSFYSVPEKQIAIVVVQPDLVSDLAENPQSQLNLIYFCKQALNPQPPALPNFSP
ncbi:MAG TPA: hypothetical protein VHG89_13445 [Verrucomicrobiae bacterium]|nr:hypothetical protein [Verrucomicrobiae bacterium]